MQEPRKLSVTTGETEVKQYIYQQLKPIEYFLPEHLHVVLVDF